ncbi:MAG: oxygen-independent coproporphyrinogen III oxidase [Limisphaerales bacterium]
MSALSVNLDLVKKYNVAGPRYTSYPPATQFTDSVKWDALEQEIVKAQDPNRDISLYFHLPFCESLCWFCGCTTVITTKHEQSGDYLAHLEREMDKMRALLNPKRKVIQLHFGGGTPTFQRPNELRRLGEMIHKRFNFADDFEAGVEIDPRRITKDHIVALREIGFNRASLGVQDFNAKVQEAVHRIQPRAQVEQAIDWIREAGFQSLNVDLIYGLPYQTPATFEDTLNQMLELSPDRLAIFSYAHVPWMKPAQKILEKEAALPAAETKLDILKLVIEKLTANGRYDYIGMDHFAKPTDELAVAQKNKTLQRNFQGYSTKGGADIYAFGMSAISQADGVYWQNEKELPNYYTAVDEGRVPFTRGYIMTDDDRIRRWTIMRLMCDLGLDYAAMSKTLGINFKEYFTKELGCYGDMEADGLVTLHENEMKVTDVGRLMIRNIAMKFDAYLPAEGQRRFSRTI